MARARGFTLIEMLVTTAVTAIIMASVMGALIANQQQYVSHSDVANIQSNLRIASVQLERAVSRAGYGIDPNYAVETRVLGVDGLEAGPTRDGEGPDGTDELVVHFRDPLFGYRLSTASEAQIDLDPATPLAEGEVIEKGQRLMVVCADGSAAAYVTAGEKVEASDTVVPLSANGPFPFRQQDRLAAGAAGEFQCLRTAGAFLTRIERRHFYIALLQDPIHGGGRPALMLSRGLDLDGDDTSDERPTNWPDVATDTGDAEVIALDIEQLQIAYGINRPSDALAAQYGLTGGGPDSDKNWVYGDEPGQPESPPFTTGAWSGAGDPDPDQPPFLGNDPGCQPSDTNVDTTCGYGGMRRYLGHAGNIRTIRFALSARSPRELAELAQATALQPVPSEPAITLENLAGPLTPSRHRRQVLRGSISLRNVFQRKHFPPPVDNTGLLNVAGG